MSKTCSYILAGLAVLFFALNFTDHNQGTLFVMLAVACGLGSFFVYAKTTEK